MGAVVMAAEMMVTSEMVKEVYGETVAVSVFARSKCGGKLFGMGGLRHVLRSFRRRDCGNVGIRVSPVWGIFQNARRT